MAVTRRTLLAGLIACPVCASAAHAAGVHWTYEGHGGPQEWGSLESGFQACAVGSQQSPINLEGAVQAAGDGPTLAWKPDAFKIVNNGHTIQADVVGDAGTATMGGKTYTLRQFHFHAPSEHALNGERTAMEAHFVHDAPGGGLLVVGVFIKPGATNAAFSEVMASAPRAEGSTALKAPLDATGLLPAQRATYRYEGSLTTPPCSEVVDWNVYATPISVAEADIAAFRAIFPMNARPLQAVNRRFLLRLN
ncbi:carbonic anhydrase [Xanthobacter versatilis]|uniref:carbonic anhydrase n=1 Tax=Xanthobacter autotrophicus (strain ATCC BAA-1158 / Py2) TaxID=78245 RepID=A7IHH9_XANP2|nr:Carbonate dehydratase [Xanthobacter autotrophicus Py2]